MGRLVKGVDSNAKGGHLQASDGYINRVLKYIPAETVTAYIGIQAIAYDTEVPAQPQTWWYIVFAVLLIGTPLYVWRMAEKDKPWKLHAILASLGFVVWSYALHATGKISPYHGEGIYIGELAGVLLILFPFLTGLFIPKTSS